MNDHHPFSVAVTVRASCTDRDALFAAVRSSLLQDNPPSECCDIMADWTAADALAELIAMAMRNDVGIDVNELEPSYSGDSDYGEFDDAGNRECSTCGAGYGENGHAAEPCEYLPS